MCLTPGACKNKALSRVSIRAMSSPSMAFALGSSDGAKASASGVPWAAQAISAHVMAPAAVLRSTSILDSNLKKGGTRVPATPIVRARHIDDLGPRAERLPVVRGWPLEPSPRAIPSVGVSPCAVLRSRRARTSSGTVSHLDTARLGDAC
ncbi:hypothetical protein HPB47_014994 [Ixodes persulcatus]|uniref:Uncharacterized protein n=1 Tax=Ixodes persulcatus TaxID=34615 RepID=A0AC60QUL3_IXOPE|nr:hypothetical protein HPB47_014994 [Ixodes persulcatus]